MQFIQTKFVNNINFKWSYSTVGKKKMSWVRGNDEKLIDQLLNVVLWITVAPTY